MAKGKKSNKLQNKSHINGHNKNLTKLFQVKTADKTVSVEKEILKKHMCYFQLIFEKDKSAIYHELPHKIYSQYFINILEFLKKGKLKFLFCRLLRFYLVIRQLI